jgi:DNA-binding Xre family transcriptional regulator
MSILQDKIDKILNEKKLTQYKLSQLIGITEQTLHQMRTGKAKFSDNVIKKILPIFEVSREEFESWILADKYPKEVLKLAIQTKKNFPYKKKPILTTKIDAILQEREMSRTDLSKVIDYSQSGLNAMITRKRSMSKSVLEKLSKALEMPQEEILAWIVADRYSLQILELALLEKEKF